MPRWSHRSGPTMIVQAGQASHCGATIGSDRTGPLKRQRTTGHVVADPTFGLGRKMAELCWVGVLGAGTPMLIGERKKTYVASDTAIVSNTPAVTRRRVCDFSRS